VPKYEEFFSISRRPIVKDLIYNWKGMNTKSNRFRRFIRPQVEEDLKTLFLSFKGISVCPLPLSK
jgi:hypothetical protein